MKKILFLIPFFLFGLVACNKGLAPEAAVDEEIAFSIESDFSAVVETKAVTEVTTANLSTVNVLATVTGSPGETAVSAFPQTSFSKQTSGTYSGKFTGGRYWPVSNPSYHFYASNASMTFAGGGTTVAPTGTTTDIVCCYLASPTYKSENTLTLEHIFARIGTMTVTAASGYTLSSISVKITPVVPKSSGTTYNIRTKAWSGTQSGSATELANTSAGTKTNDFLLCPGSDYVLTATWTATRGGYSETFTNISSAAINLQAGKTSNISCTLGGKASDVVFNVSVTPWTANSVTATFSY